MALEALEAFLVMHKDGLALKASLLGAIEGSN